MHLKKGDKLIRSIKQLLQVNYKTLRNKISMCSPVRNFDGFSFLRNKVEVDAENQSASPEDPITPKIKLTYN